MEALKGHVAETLAATGPGPELWVEHGTPYAVIVEQVEALGADLLVLGAQGRSGRKAGLGSITERALRHAPCSVLIAREQGADQRIVAATDFSDSARRALSAAADEARRRGARLTIVHSIGPLVAPPMPFEAASWPAPGAISVEQRDQARREAQARLEDLAGLEVDCELVVTEGDPAADVVKAAEERSAGLVVVGGVGRTGLARVLLGSVAEKVARRAPCSVLVAR
jgi:nucleotide-binding universal stress UspA family protein